MARDARRAPSASARSCAASRRSRAPRTSATRRRRARRCSSSSIHDGLQRDPPPRAPRAATTADALVEADEARLGQVFINLLVNAAQAIADGSADGNEIRVVTGDRRRRARVRRGSRHRAGHRRPSARQDLRPVLHDEAGRRRHRPRALDLPQHHQRHGRADRATSREPRGAVFRVTLPRASAPAAAVAAAPAPAPIAVARARGPRRRRRGFDRPRCCSVACAEHDVTAVTRRAKRSTLARGRTVRRDPLRPDDAGDVGHGAVRRAAAHSPGGSPSASCS